MALCQSAGKPVPPAGSLWYKESWEGTNDMAPFPCSHDLTRPHGHTTLKHTLQFYTLSNRFLRESRVGVQGATEGHHQSIWHDSLSYLSA